MIKSIKEKPAERFIDLTGPDGNAYVLLGYASNYAKQLGLDPKEIQTEMTMDDYDNLVDVFNEYFGSFITLYR